MSFFSELRRRHVFKVAAAYLVVAWLVLQVSNIVAPIFELPTAFERGVFLLLAIGFPIALVFAWALELTPDGIRIDKISQRSGGDQQRVGRTLNQVTIGVLVLAVALFALDKFVWTETSTDVVQSTEVQRRIAVLPFVNVSGDSEQEYFSDGLSEELLNLLANVPQLRVTSRTSAFSFKGRNVTIAEIGQALDVEHVLEGSVRRSGDTIRISAQLVEVGTDAPIWSDAWDRNFGDVFAIQDEIAAAVVSTLKVTLLGEAPHALETSPEAYELYLRAGFLAEQANTDGYRRADTLNRRVLALDPTYAPAWTQRAEIHYYGSAFGAWEPDEAIPIAREAAQESIRLFENAAWAHAILVFIAISYDFDYAAAAAELETALSLAPENVIVLQAAAEFAQRQGRLEEAIRYIEKTHVLDPTSGRRITQALPFFYSGRQDEALEIWRDEIQQRPLAQFLHRSLALALLETGDIEGALAEIELEPAEGYKQQGLALIYEAMGDRERSTEALEKLLEGGIRWTFEITEVYSFRGELDDAFLWMDRAIERRDRGLRHVTYSPYLDNMRDDPRFERVLSRIGLKP